MDHTSDFVRLWTRHQAEVGRYVFMMIPRQADAAEVLQDVSVLLWKKWDQYDPERPFVPWAIRFAYLEVLKWRQKLARERKRSNPVLRN
jgi:RNA polymerase sigma-70 factor (ECF subfamily)